MAMKYVRFDESVRCIPIPSCSDYDRPVIRDTERLPVVIHESDADRMDRRVNQWTKGYTHLLGILTACIIVTIVYAIIIVIHSMKRGPMVRSSLLTFCLLIFSLMQILAGWLGVYGRSRYFLRIDRYMQLFLIVVNTVALFVKPKLAPTIISALLLLLQSVILLVNIRVDRLLKQQQIPRS